MGIIICEVVAVGDAVDGEFILSVICTKLLSSQLSSMLVALLDDRWGSSVATVDMMNDDAFCVSCKKSFSRRSFHSRL